MFEEPKPNPWDTEKGDDNDNPGDINSEDSNDDDAAAENISPDIPPDLWNDLVWSAIRVAIDKSSTRDDVFKWMKDWNDKNNPHLSQKEVDKKTLWALRHWDNKFRRK